jgi:hypothetical protein
VVEHFSPSISAFYGGLPFILEVYGIGGVACVY